MALELDAHRRQGRSAPRQIAARTGPEGRVRGQDLPRSLKLKFRLMMGICIALAKQGSADAYDRLVRRYYSFVRLKASSYFLIGGDCDDLIQEGLVGLYKAIRDFRSDRESLVPQLRRALHHAPDHHRGQDRDAQQAHAAQRLRVVLRHAGRRDRLRADARRDAARLDRADPVNQVISSEELRSLVACLSTVLSDLESRVLSLYLDGHSYTAIGEQLGCDCKTVDNALQRVKRKVGAHLALARRAA